MKTTFFTIVLFLISLHAFSEEKVLYCQSEHATGILFDKNINSFRTGEFKLDRFTLKFKEDYSKLLGWSIFDTHMNCRTNSGKYTDESSRNNIICNHDLEETGDFLIYNIVTKKFLGALTSRFGYTEPKGKSRYDTNTMYAGKCEDF